MPLYLVHFDQPYWHAQHYLGWCPTVTGIPDRLAKHRSGQGANLLKVVTAAGISWRLVRVWSKGGRKDERIKKQTSLKKFCPLCKEEIWTRQRAYRRGKREAAVREVAPATQLPGEVQGD